AMIAQADAELSGEHKQKQKGDEAFPGEEQGTEEGRQMKDGHHRRLAQVNPRARRVGGLLVHRLPPRSRPGFACLISGGNPRPFERGERTLASVNSAVSPASAGTARRPPSPERGRRRSRWGPPRDGTA